MLWNLSFIFFFKQKTAYEMRISDWSSDVCSSDLPRAGRQRRRSFARDLSVVHHELPPFRPAHPAFERDVRGARDRGQWLTAKAQRRHPTDGVGGPLEGRMAFERGAQFGSAHCTHVIADSEKNKPPPGERQPD